jgi:hypothetical protein
LTSAMSGASSLSKGMMIDVTAAGAARAPADVWSGRRVGKTW